jgi:hypothetical protein
VIDYEKKLSEAVEEIKLTEHKEYKKGKNSRFSNLLEEIEKTYGENICLQGCGFVSDPLLDFIDCTNSNILGCERNGKYHLWEGDGGYIIASIVKRPPKRNGKVCSRDGTMSNFDAHEFYKGISHRWDDGKVTLFFDNASDASIVYFMKKTPKTGDKK